MMIPQRNDASIIEYGNDSKCEVSVMNRPSVGIESPVTGLSSICKQPITRLYVVIFYKIAVMETFPR